MASTSLTVAEQAELSLAREATHVTVPPQMVAMQKTFSAALGLATQVSGLEDKEIYLTLGIDAGHWSRIKKGEAHFQLDLLAEFCKTVGNTVVPEWIAHQVGCALVLLKSEAERRAEEAEKALAKEREINKVLKDLLAGKAA